MKPQTQKQKLASNIAELLQDIEKAAESNTELGGYAGDSTHPSAKVDDQTQPATEGSRTQENAADIKADVGKPSVDSAKENKGGTAADDHVQIGTNVTATGDDPSNETASVKSDNFDPGSTHPARVDNDELDGKKYASEREEFSALCKLAHTIGTELLAEIATTARPQAKKQANAPAAGSLPQQTAQAGYDLANAMTNLSPEQEKQAMDQIVVEQLCSIRQLATARAEKAAQFLQGRAQQLRKRADETEMADPNAQPTGEEGGGEGGGGDIEAQIAALLAQGGDMGAEGAAESMGAPPAGGGGGDPGLGGDPSAMGGDPAAMGGDPAAMGGDPAAMGGDPAAGGQEISPEDLAMLEQILQDEGVQDPAALAQKAGSARRFVCKTAAQKQKYAAYQQYIRELKAANN